MTITNRTKIYVLLVLSALLSPLTAQAAFITLSPATAVNAVNDADTITLDISLDFTADATFGGGFDIEFDSDALLLISFSQNTVGDPFLARAPDILPGLLSGWAAGDFNGLTGPAILGSVTFEVLATMGTNTSVSAQDTASVAGPFVSWNSFLLQPVTYNTIDIVRATVPPPTPAPEPATIMLFGLGILIAGAQRSRNKRD